MVQPSLDFGIEELCAYSDHKPELPLPVWTGAHALRDMSLIQSRRLCSGTPKSMTMTRTLKQRLASREYSRSELTSIVLAGISSLLSD